MTSMDERMLGRRFGRRVVIARAEGKDRWAMQCDCGTPGNAIGGHLRAGKALSCGCLQREKAAATHRTHGLSRRFRAEYLVWKGMRSRCANPTNPAFPRYGGRGVRVCERWDSFENFIADMGARPADRESIERKDNDGHYEPSNCVWATRREQNRNQRRTRRVTVDGSTKSAADWEDAAGLQRKRVCARLDAGWPAQDAVRRPAMARSKLSPDQRQAIVDAFGAGGVSMRALGKRFGVHNTTIRSLVQGKSWRQPS
ncbi:MAG TPA: hypothetical protein VK509_23930 [Polyangiales bacterium]|nr:hypothetical protein [Polyangiales bacterium]